MSSVVEQIKDRINIVDVVSSYVKLEKAGSNLKGRCPFHNEKTPSFFVSPDRGTFYCFGCNVKGDVFSFVQQIDGLEFPQALKMLAEKAGVSLSEREFSANQDQKTLYTVLEAATIFFERGLGGAVGGAGASAAASETAKKYLLDRGLKEKTIRDWRIGYEGNEWRGLYDHLLSNSFSVQDMIATGLIKKTGASDGYYDVFRSRIVFPIWNANGKIVAFSGRIFPNDDSAPKYLNSPETALFKKSDTLYGFDRAKTAIRRKGYSIVVEGQMDLIMSHQAGFENTVATSGTALTDMHLKRLMRIAPRVMFAYDSDTAGIAAARRAAELGLSLGIEVKIAALPAGEDPASLLLKSPGAYAKVIKDSEHIIDFSVAAIVRSTPGERDKLRKIREEIFPLLLLLKGQADRSYFLKRVAQVAGVREESLWEDLKIASKGQTGQNSSASAKSPGQAAGQSSPGGSRKFSIERTLLGVFYWRKKTELADKLKEIIGEERFVALEAEVAGEKDSLIFEVEKYLEGSDRAPEIVEDLLTDLQAEEYKMQFARTMAELRAAEQARDPVKIEELLKRCSDISNHLIKLQKHEKTK